MLIDPGAEYAAVNGAVCGREVKAVLLTHAHFDHMLYARPWLKDGVKLYVHKLDAPALADPSLNLSGVVGAQLTLPDADVLLEEGDCVEEAGIRFDVLHTPGHTPGSVCYRHEKTLFCGDTLFYQGYGRVDLAGGKLAANGALPETAAETAGRYRLLPRPRHENEDRLGTGGKCVKIAVQTSLPAFQNDIGDVVRLFYGEGAAVGGNAAGRRASHAYP